MAGKNKEKRKGELAQRYLGAIQEHGFFDISSLLDDAAKRDILRYSFNKLTGYRATVAKELMANGDIGAMLTIQIKSPEASEILGDIRSGFRGEQKTRTSPKQKINTETQDVTNGQGQHYENSVKEYEKNETMETEKIIQTETVPENEIEGNSETQEVVVDVEYVKTQEYFTDNSDTKHITPIDITDRKQYIVPHKSLRKKTSPVDWENWADVVFAGQAVSARDWMFSYRKAIPPQVLQHFANKKTPITLDNCLGKQSEFTYDTNSESINVQGAFNDMEIFIACEYFNIYEKKAYDNMGVLDQDTEALCMQMTEDIMNIIQDNVGEMFVDRLPTETDGNSDRVNTYLVKQPELLAIQIRTCLFSRSYTQVADVFIYIQEQIQNGEKGTLRALLESFVDQYETTVELARMQEK